MFGGGEALAYARADVRQRAVPGGPRRRRCAALPAQIDGLDTLAVAAVRRLGRPIPFDAHGRRRARGSTSSARRGHLRARVVLRRRPGRGPARALPRQDRRDRRDRARAAGHPPGLVARRHDGRAGDPRHRDRHAAATARRCARPARATTSRSRSRSRCSRRCSALVPAPVDRAADRARRRASLYAVAAQLLFGAGWIVAGRRAARRPRGRLRRHAARPLAHARRSSARARATCSPASCPTPSSTRC